MTHPDTRAVHAGREDLTGLGVHVPPIDLSTTYPVPDLEGGGHSYEVLAQGGRPDDGTSSLVYQRLWNPNVARAEEALAGLERAEEAVAFASGMAAASATLLACVAAGRPHVVAVRPLYGGTDHLLATGLLGTEVTWAEADEIADAIATRREAKGDDTGLVVLETPANPSLELVDIAEVVGAAGDVPVLVDNTFATPVLQRPLEHGAALSLHSATKYLGGHGDLMGGVVATSGEWATRLRQVRAVTGALLHPMAAYQLHRGLQTLPVRVRAQQATAGEIATWLSEHELVETVHYPGLEGSGDGVHPQMQGPGAMIAFMPRGGRAVAAQVAQRCRLITHAVSLGGVDTLIQHPASLTHRPVADDAKPSDRLLRLSVGLEAAEDLVADLDQALRGAADAGGD
ncbi:PLP-dependent transferase [Marihabitans asiaticum]|uniref:homocysteine desulfhydrase n=1 Tax=Marihabitans asiaticum TaxID=415218 RepID=A0A560WES5_9MICO|nr:PLP-dependent aspartate aminotransferase family protein [Marihabitans asiaticum]TWD16030.1 cystathionine gamma-synthase/methionine-gamma-lyase [Marihabitans asiaticum]